jgi:glycosyltransferase involved in cell wall biosynthesis
MNKLPISAIVVGYNESELLEACLHSISFCNEILFIDLGSTDKTVQVAQKYTEHIFYRDRSLVPSCEMAQSEFIKKVANDWVLLIDPDEVVDPTLAAQIIHNFDNYTHKPLLGAVYVPWQFYFLKKKLNGTPWGGQNRKFLLIHKNRFEILPIIHYGRKLMPGFEEINIEYNANRSNILQHYWMNSLSVFIAKHNRYLQKEGKDRYDLGKRTTIKQLLKQPYNQFKFAFIQRKGYLDGLVGLFLSLFWAWYQTNCQIALYRYTKQQTKL